MSLIQEYPPESLPEEVRDYLQRRFIDIDALLGRAAKFPERKEMPYKPQVGDVHYFGDPTIHNYDAVISSEGFWGLTSNGWVKIGGSMDFALDVARGLIPGTLGINKFGRNLDVDTALEDLVDAGGIWVAPTIARTHDIISTSVNDTDTTGTGARKIEVFGLTSWGTAEVSEVVSMLGTSITTTVNSYVIIHRMKVIESGSGIINQGIITATANIDGTVTAQINAGQGQTQMALYGIPSTQKAYISNFWAQLNKAGGAATVDTALLINESPDSALVPFVVKHNAGIDSDANSYFQHKFSPYFKVDGPAIIKLSAESSAVDADVSGGFDIYLVNN